MSAEVVGSEFHVAYSELLGRCERTIPGQKRVCLKVTRNRVTWVECRLQSGEPIVLEHVQ
jgi:hypothetical protein